MNTINLQGIIKDITFSHTIGDVEYNKASLIVTEGNHQDTVLLKFKKFANTYKDGDSISLQGNIRTYSYKDDDNKFHVIPYVFTYFDEGDGEINTLSIDGNICKKGTLRKTKKGIDVLDFILANNIDNNGHVFNTYLPVVAWGRDAKRLAKLPIGTFLRLKGHLSSRTYKKPTKDNDFEFHIAYEVNIDSIISEE